jgi:integrase/recombinase XerD
MWSEVVNRPMFLAEYLEFDPFSLHIIRVGRLPFLFGVGGEKRSTTMLETYYEDKKTLANYRRGLLGPYFDGFADYFTKRGYAQDSAQGMIKSCSKFNAFLFDQGISNIRFVKSPLVELFLDVYLSNFRGASGYKHKAGIDAKCALNHLFAHLSEIGVLQPEIHQQVFTRYSWLMEPYMKHLREERELTRVWTQTIQNKLTLFLESLGDQASPEMMKVLRAEVIEEFIKKNLENSRDNLRLLASALRGFLRFCFRNGFTDVDLSGVIPSIPQYRLSSLPRGMNDPILKRILHSVPRKTPSGLRDYAILLLMMAYGIRGKRASELLLEDIHWDRSTIRIRSMKGGKEVVLPLLEPVGEAILQYLRHRPKNRVREVFLWSRAPFRSLTGLAISQIAQKYMVKAKAKTYRSGSSTFRHSWAIRALAHDTPMKAIADVLGHRYLDTTYIYAKADLKTLRQVAMPWVGVIS